MLTLVQAAMITPDPSTSEGPLDRILQVNAFIEGLNIPIGMLETLVGLTLSPELCMDLMSSEFMPARWRSMMALEGEISLSDMTKNIQMFKHNSAELLMIVKTLQTNVNK